MTFIQDILEELQQEANTTKQFIKKVPFDKAGYRPTETSAELIGLAVHLVEIIAWWKSIIQDSSKDFANFSSKNITSQKELLNYFNTLLHEAETILNNTNEEDLQGTWSMKHGDEVLFTLPKKKALRTFCLNHHIHHRAQLSMYLRLLNIPMPGSYGPSADGEYDGFENQTTLKKYSTL